MSIIDELQAPLISISIFTNSIQISKALNISLQKHSQIFATVVQVEENGCIPPQRHIENMGAMCSTTSDIDDVIGIGSPTRIYKPSMTKKTLR